MTVRLLAALLALALCVPAGAGAAVAAEMAEMPRARLQALDKSTARTLTFDVEVGRTVQMGTLFIRAAACRASPPMAEPEAAAFVQVWERPPATGESEPEDRWVFSGWMFASSPAVSAMDHPVYDVWVVSCLGPEEAPENAPEEEG